LINRGIQLTREQQSRDGFMKFEHLTYDQHNKAKALENVGELIQAAQLYWNNIAVNGSYLNRDFERLLVIFYKLKQPKNELKIAQVYLYFARKKEKIKKRIANLEKRLGNK
jgi:hypothetical protein